MLVRNIFLALSYALVFNCGLAFDELHTWLPLSKTTPSRLKKTLDSLVQSGQINFKNGQYYLGRSPKINSSSVTFKRKLRIATQAAGVLKILPSVQLVALSGSLAAGRPQRSSDIDFFIITSPGRVWLTRLATVLLLGLLGLSRRRNRNSVQDRICLNMFLSSDNLKIKSQNLYTARELLQIIPLINRNLTYENFIRQNNWTLKIFPNFALPSAGQKKLSPGPKLTSQNLSFDKFLFRLQLFYMRRHITTETILLSEIRFHPKDYQTIILKKFLHLLDENNLTLSKAEHKILISQSLDKKN